jgi:acyl transferase domain-containing protein/thioesterase domain-containing protein
MTTTFSDDELLREALIKLRRVKQENETLTRQLRERSTEPLAIVGVACRFPGEIHGLEQYWDFLLEGRNAIGTVPSDRWRMEDFYDPDPQCAGRSHVPFGGFLRDIDKFDNIFFEVSPREAACLDPKQRLLLELAWEAIENATLTKRTLSRESVGVYVGISGSEYLEAHGGVAAEMLSGHHVGGTATSMAAGRLSYALGLTGPSIALDTSCSSSLVALHLASQALHLGECQTALVGAVNLMLSPRTSVAISKAGMLSADGQCKAFADDANGYVRSEGCAVIVVRRLTDALESGLPVLGVVRSTAVNQDGGSGGLTVPNPRAQVDVIRKALNKAGIAPAQVHLIEAHGTGTALGDPIEMLALRQVFGARSAPLVVTSAKTNLGHLEACAGLAGLLKGILALRHRRVPAHLHLRRPNPAIAWGSWPVSVPTETTNLPVEGPLIAGVSSFGFSGTNAHVVLQSPPARVEGGGQPLIWSVLMCSAKTEHALSALTHSYAERLAGMSPHEIASACYTSAVGRDHFRYRVAVAGVPGEELVRALRRKVDAVLKLVQAPQVALLLTDDPAVNFGHQMAQTCATFRGLALRCQETCAAFLPQGTTVLPWEVGAGQVLEPELASFVVQYCAAQRWRMLGVNPDVVWAKGVGEFVAACLVEALSLEDGLRLMWARVLVQRRDANAHDKWSSVLRSIAWGESKYEIVSLQSGAVSEENMRAADHWFSREISVCRSSRAAIPHAEQVDVVLCASTGDLSAGATRDLGTREGCQWIRTFAAGEDDWSVQARSSAVLHAMGVDIDWARWYAGNEAPRISLPNYPFQRRRFWLKEGSESPTAFGASAGTQAPLVSDKHEHDRYQLRWRDAGRPLDEQRHVAGQHWLVLADETLAPTLVPLAAAAGVSLILVRARPKAPEADDRVLRADGRPFLSFAELFDESGTGGIGIDHVLHLWSLDDERDASWQLQQRRACGSLLDLVQALQGRSLRPRLSIVTQRAQPVDAGAVRPQAATLWGLARSLGAEHPELACKCIDWDSEGAHPSVLWTELCAQSIESMVGYRKGVRHVLRVEHADQQQTASALPKTEQRLNANGTYVVAGGLGFLGRRAAQSLAAMGAGHIVLTGRRMPEGAARSSLDAAIASMKRHGTGVSVELADVADRSAVDELVQRCATNGKPLKGVIHAAGVLDDGVLTALDWRRIERVMAPKVSGAWNLHLSTRELPLDFFVLFSSTASMFVSPGQANYAAANAFLDALAHHRRAAGLTAISINWGAWEGSEMMSAAAMANVRRASGDLGVLPLEEGMRTLEDLLSSREAQVGVVRVNWNKVAKRAAAMGVEVPPLMRDVLLPRAEGRGADAGDQLWADLDRMAKDEQCERVQGLVASQFRAVLALDDESLRDPSQPLQELGLDSLMSLEIRNRLQGRFGERLSQPLPQDILFDCPSIAQLTRFLLRSIFDGSSTQLDPEATAAETENLERSLVCLQRGTPGVSPLILVHPIGGSVSCYLALAREMDSSRPVFALRCPSAEGSWRFRSVEQMATDYLAAVHVSGLQEPYVFGGHSMGGVIAFEMARQLTDRGQRTDTLIIIDSPRPGTEFVRSQLDTEPTLRRLFCLDMGLPQTIADAVTRDDGDLSCFLDRTKHAAIDAGLTLQDDPTGQLHALYQRFCWHAQALISYLPRPCGVRLLYYQARGTEWSSAFDWGALVSTVDRTQVPGDHFSVLHPEGAAVIAAHLQRELLHPTDTPMEHVQP